MTQRKINPRTIVLLLFMIVVAILRVVINPKWGFEFLSNFSPIGAMALFGGAYFTSKKAYVFPLITLWISHILLMRFVYGNEWKLFDISYCWVYGAFILMVLTGNLLLKRVSVKNILLAAFTITFIHWIVTDIGVWLSGTMYPKTMEGFWACLAAAIPYERNFLSGTLLYSAIMFGSFEWMKSRYPSLKTDNYQTADA